MYLSCGVSRCWTFLEQKSLYISHTLNIFYGKEIEIWAGFEPVGSAEKVSD